MRNLPQRGDSGADGKQPPVLTALVVYTTTTTTVWVELTGGTGCVVCYITSHKEGVAVNGLLWTPWFGATFMN